MDSLLGGILLFALLHCYFGNVWDRLYERLFGRGRENGS
jgi:hypothetical protein